MRIFIDNVIIEGQDKGELYIESEDERSVVLNLYRPNKEGKITCKNLGYFRTINQALQDCLKLEIHNTTASTIHEVMKDNERLDKKIDSYVFAVKKGLKNNVDTVHITEESENEKTFA